MAINKAERFDVFKLEPNGMPTWRGGYPSLEMAVVDAQKFSLEDRADYFVADMLTGEQVEVPYLEAALMRS